MSTQETDQVTIRPATHADCDAIKAIDRNLHDGFDRILYYFHYDVGVETKFSYVAEISGKVVGYASGHIIDDGYAIVMRDGRVAEKQRGNHVMKKLLTGIITAAMARFPNLRWRVGMRSNTVALEKAIKRFPSRKIALSMPVETFQIHSDKLKALIDDSRFNILKKKFQIDDIVSFSKYEALRLLTEEIRFLDFAPVRPMIGWQPSGWHASTLGNQLQTTDLFISRCPNTKKVQAFSFLTTMRSDFGVKTGIEFYCDRQARVQNLTIAHLLHFIRELARFHTHINIIAYFHHPAEVSRECVREVLNVQLGIPSHFSDTSTVPEANLLAESEQKSKL